MAVLTANLSVPLAEEASALVEALRRSVVRVTAAYGHGSGVIWQSDGLIVTNHHVVARDRAEVELADGRRLAAAVVARDPHTDLAALRVPARDLETAPIGNAAALRVGDLIIAVGHPFGVRGAATLGIVSASVGTAGRLRSQSRGEGYRARGAWSWRGGELLQADVALAPGSSGGPLADAAGRVVGIASMVIGPGIALAIPSHVVDRFVATMACPTTVMPAAA